MPEYVIRFRFSLAFIVLVFLTVSCGPSVRTFEGMDFSLTAPANLEFDGMTKSKRGAVSSEISLVDRKNELEYSVKVFYAMLNPQYVLEDSYVGDIEVFRPGVYVAYTDYDTYYAFNQDSCTVVLSVPGDSELTFDSFTDWRIDHDYDLAAHYTDKHPENDRPFLYEAYAVFSPGIDYALTDDYITMREFRYNYDTNKIDVTILARDDTMSYENYMANKNAYDKYIAAKVKDFAVGTGIYYTYCRSKGAVIDITVRACYGEYLPVITVDL